MSDSEQINVSYTNYRGETRVRRVLLGEVRYGTTEWHDEPTWLIKAFDLDHPAKIWKEFDLTKCDFNRDYMPDEVEKLRTSLSRIVDRSENGLLGTSKVQDMAAIARGALPGGIPRPSPHDTAGDG